MLLLVERLQRVEQRKERNEAHEGEGKDQDEDCAKAVAGAVDPADRAHLSDSPFPSFLVVVSERGFHIIARGVPFTL
jgi:hypothetical protein